jgi:tetratricopeptide (TPR) repeat protein
MQTKRSSVVAAALLCAATGAWAAGSSSSSSRQPQPSTYDQGVAAVEAKDYRRAASLFERVLRREPRNADAWNYLGFSRRNLGRMDESLAAYEKALGLEPLHRGANEYLGELYLKMGRTDLAKQRLEVLERACPRGCAEYDDLKEAIERGSG